MKINDQVQNYLNERKNKKKRLSATALLSLLITFAVVASLISPAVSLTLEQYIRENPSAMGMIDENAGMILQAGAENDSGVITDAYDTIPDGAKDFGPQITNVVMDNLTDNGDGTKSALFNVSYSFPAGSGIGTNGTAYIYYQIPENIYIESDYVGDNCKVKDNTSGWLDTPAGKKADGLSGYYSIDENGMMVIKFTPEYLEYIEKNSGAVSGAISFTGEIRRNNTADGDQTIQFGGQSVPTTVPFDDKNLTANKGGTPKFDSSGNPYVDWTITINNPGKYTELNGATLTDTMFPADATNVTVNPSDVGSFNGTTFTFGNNVGNYETITFTYRTNATKDTTSVTNNATLTYGENQTIPMSQTVPFNLDSIKGKITKSGTPSYDKQTDKEFGYIEWTVEAYRDYGVSAKDYVVQDAAFANLGSDNNNKLVSVKDANGNDVQYTLSGDKMTINSDTDRVKITYRTPVTSEYQKVSNTASITPPGSDTPDNSNPKEVEYNQSSKYSFTKVASSYTDKSVTWKVTVDCSYKGMFLDGSVITDDAFKSIGTLTNANVLIMRDGWQTVDESNELSLLQKTSDDSFTIVEANGVDKISKVEITYEVPLTDEQIQNRLNNDIEVTNTAYFAPGGSDPKAGAPANQKLGKLSNSLTKRLTSTTASETVKGFYENESDDNRFANRELSWQVEVGRFNGFSGENIKLLDSPYVSGGGDHYIIPNEADIVIQGRTSTGTYAPLESTDYTIKYYTVTENEDGTETRTEISGSEHADEFEIVFNESVDDKNYTYVLVDYKTIAEVSSLTIPEDSTSVTAVYDNTVGIGGAIVTSNQKYSFTKTDPYDVPKLRITGNKDWGNTPSTKQFNVKFQLQQKKGENGIWANMGEPVTLAVGTTNYTWTDLPQYEAAVGEAKFYYRVVELDADGNPIEPEGTIKNSTDIFNVSYDNNYTNGINNTGSLTITNAWDYMYLTVTKQWVDRGNADDRPETIYVERLEWIEDGSPAWESNGGKVALTKDNGYSYTWENLPRKTTKATHPTYEEGLTIKYSAWEVKRTNQTYDKNHPLYDSSDTAKYDTKLDDYIATSYNTTGITDTGTVYVTNSWKYMDLSLNKVWTGGTDSTKPDTIQVQLYRVTTNGTEIPVIVGDDGTITQGFAPVTLNKTDNYAYKWEKLLRYEQCTDENSDYDIKEAFSGNNKTYNEVKYVVKEVEADGDSYKVKAADGYVQHWEESTINGSTGSVKLTNEYNSITLYASKSWDGENNDTSGRPSSITIRLYQKLPNGEFTDMGDDYVKTISSSNWNEVISWTGLPKYDENGNEILYKAVEDAVSGYTAKYKTEKYQYTNGYDYDASGTNLDGDKFLITNTILPKFEKYPVTADELTNINGTWGEYNSTKITNNTITSDQLENWTVKDVDTDGDGTAEPCYLFRWYLDIDDNTYYTSSNNNQIVDTLPEGSVLYESTDGFGVAVQTYSQSGKYVEMLHGTQSDWQKYTYDKTANTVTFHMQRRKFITYCIAIPKSIVDSQVESNGSYVIANSAKLEDNSATTGASLTINKDMTIRPDESLLNKGYIVKDSNSELAQAKYSIIVNPDGKTISSDGTIDIHDIFTITGYKPPNGTRTDGSNLLDAHLSHVAIYESDANGSEGRQLSISEYSYRDETKVVTEVNKTDWDSSKVSINTSYRNWDGLRSYYFATLGDFYPANLELVIEITGNANESFTITKESSTFEIVTEDSDTKYDATGKAKIKIRFPNQCDSRYNSAGGFLVSNSLTDSGIYKIISSQIVTTTVETQNQLTLTVPDGKPLLVEYYYDLKANANTPGNPTIGQMPPDGSTIYMKNEASLDTYLGTVTDSTDENSILVKKATATSSTASASKIRKRDVGDYTYRDLSAEFIIAKWDGSKWVYASEFVDVTDSSQITRADIVYGDNSLTESDNKPPANAAKFNIQSGERNINFTSGTLYKIIETTAPEGYQSTNWSATATLDDMAEFTTYVMYDGSLPATLPTDVNAADIVSVIKDGTLTIYNNRLIDIGAEKTWVPAPSKDDASGMSIKADLYWSYTKSSTIPADAQRVDGAGTATLNAQLQDGNYVWKQEAIWENVPNGKDGRPIYYYVRETSYTIGDTTYTYDSSTGKYMNGDAEGPYQPAYSNNAVNADGVVSITNSEGLFVKKQWLRSDNSVMDNPPTDEIAFRLYGISNNQLTSTPIFEGTLTAPDWEDEIDLESSVLKGYTAFMVEEVLSQEQITSSMYNYSISDSYNTTDGAGTITLINKSREAVDVDVRVQKVWSDGESLHTDDQITVRLYQTTRYLTVDELATLANGGSVDGATQYGTLDENQSPIVMLNADSEWTHVWTDLPNKNEDTGAYYKYYAVEEPVDGYESVYTRSDNSGLQIVTVTNKLPAGIKLEKQWLTNTGATMDTSETSVEINLYKKSLYSDSSSEEDDDTPIVPADQTVKVMAIGDSITDGYWPGSNDGYRKFFYNALRGYTIDMVGTKGSDSVTVSLDDGTTVTYDGQHEGYSGYAIRAYTGSDNNILNSSGSLASTYAQRSGIYETIKSSETVKNNSPDIVLLMAGTNDVLDSGKKDCSILVNDSNNVMNGWDFESRYNTLLDEIYSQYSNVHVFIMSPTPIDSDNVDWLKGHGTSLDANLLNARTAIQNIVAERTANGQKITYVDTYTAFTNDNADYTQYLYDYCHPDNAGYKLIGETVASAVEKSYYGIGADDDTIVIPDPIDGVPELFNDDGTLKSEYAFDRVITLSADSDWSATLSELDSNYVYYAVENNADSSWTPGYLSNGQVPVDGVLKTTVITNTKTLRTLDLSVEKTWIDGSGSGRPDSLALTLQRSTNGTDWTDTDVAAPTPVKNGNVWTYTYENLPGEDGSGTLYLYRVQETAPTGYTLTRSENNNGISVDSSDSVIKLRNTKTISLEVAKDWEGTENPPTSVDFLLYQSINPDSNTTLPLKFTLSAESVKVQVGTSMDVIASNEIQSVTSADSNIATVTFNGKTITITGKTPGKTTITVTDKNGTVKTIAVEVTAKPTLVLTANPNANTLVAGNTIQLTPSMSDGSALPGTVTYTSIDSSVATVDSSGKITGVNQGEVTITATCGDLTATYTVNVTLPDFQLTGNSHEIAVGEQLQLTPTPAYGTFTYSSSSTAVTVDANGKVTGVTAGGSAVITATRTEDSKTATFEVTVKEAEQPSYEITASEPLRYYFEEGKKVTKIVVTFDETDGYWLAWNFYKAGNENENSRDSYFDLNSTFGVEYNDLKNIGGTLSVSGKVVTVTIPEGTELNLMRITATGTKYSISSIDVTYADSGTTDPTPTPTITISEPIDVRVGETVQLSAEIENGTGTPTYRIASGNAATITSDGKLTGVSEGTVTVEASVTIDGTIYTDTVTVTVDPKPVLVLDSVSLDAGNSVTLTLDEETASDADVTSGLRDTDVVKYRVTLGDAASISDNDYLTGNKGGTAKIQAYIENEDGSDYVTSNIATATVNKNLAFPGGVGEYVKLDLTLHVADNSSGCIGFSVFKDNTSYWVQYIWTAQASGEVTVDLTGQDSSVEIQYGDNQKVTDETLKAEILALVQAQESCSFQAWWINNDGAITLEDYSYEAQPVTTTVTSAGPTPETTTTTVEPVIVAPTVELEVDYDNLWVGETAALSPTVGGVDNPVVAYEFMDIATGNTYATIDGNTLTANAEGTFAIRARYQYGTDSSGTPLYAYSEKIPITITEVPSPFTIAVNGQTENVNLTAGDTATIEISEAYANLKPITFECGGEQRVIRINEETDDELYAIGEATATVKAVYEHNGKKYYSNTVTVNVTARDILATTSGTTTVTEFFELPNPVASKYLYGIIDVDETRTIQSIAIENDSTSGEAVVVRFFYEDFGDSGRYFDLQNSDNSNRDCGSVSFTAGEEGSKNITNFPTTLDKLYIVPQQQNAGGAIKVTITYTEPLVNPAMNLTVSDSELIIGETATLTPLFENVDGTPKVTYSKTGDAVTLNNDGIITAFAEGTSEITASCTVNGKTLTDSVTVTVQAPTFDLTIGAKDKTIVPGEIIDSLNVTTNSPLNVIYEVDNGTIYDVATKKALAPGTVTITAYLAGYKGVYTDSVTATILPLNITLDKTELYVDETINVTIDDEDEFREAGVVFAENDYRRNVWVTYYDDPTGDNDRFVALTENDTFERFLTYTLNGVTINSNNCSIKTNHIEIPVTNSGTTSTATVNLPVANSSGGLGNGSMWLYGTVDVDEERTVESVVIKTSSEVPFVVRFFYEYYQGNNPYDGTTHKTYDSLTFGKVWDNLYKFNDADITPDSNGEVSVTLTRISEATDKIYIVPQAGTKGGNFEVIITYADEATTTPDPPSIALTADKASAPLGEKIQFTATPANIPEGSTSSVTYEITSGSEYAEIDASSGLLTTTGVGDVTVRATLTVNGETYTAEKTVTVEAPTITITADRNTYMQGEYINFVVERSCETLGYELVLYEDSTYTVIGGTTGKYVTIENGKYLTVKNGTNKSIYARYTGEYSTIMSTEPYNITVKRIGVKTQDNAESLTMNVGESVTLKYNVSDDLLETSGAVLSYDENEYFDFDVNTKTITAKKATSSEYEFILKCTVNGKEHSSGAFKITINEAASGGDSNEVSFTNQTLSNGGTPYVLELDSSKTISQLILDVTPADENYSAFNVIFAGENSWTNYDFGLISSNTIGWNNTGGTITYADGQLTLNLPSNFSSSQVTFKVTNGCNWIINSCRIVYSDSADTEAQALSLLSDDPVVGVGSFLPIVSASNEEASELHDFAEGPMRITLSATGQDDSLYWVETIENLPMYDENGNVYYYWIEEDMTTAPGYEPTYSFDGDNDANTLYSVKADALKTDGNPHMTVINTMVETPGVVMPSTGGEGTMKFYYTGGAMILLSLFAGSNRIRRRIKERRRQ